MIEKSEDINMLPVAHTCSKCLELPQYKSKEILRDKLQMALTEGTEGFFIGWNEIQLFMIYKLFFNFSSYLEINLTLEF